MRFPIKANSLLMRFLIAIVICMLVPSVILILVSNSRIETIEENTARQYMSANLHTVSSSIDGILRNVENLYVPLLIDQDFSHTVQSIHSYESRDAYQDFLDTNEIRDTLQETAATNSNVFSVYAGCIEAGRFFSSRVNWNREYNHFDAEASAWYQTYLENSFSSWFLTRAMEDDRPILTSYRTIKRNHTLYGLISLNIDTDILSEQLGNILPNGDSYCFLTDPNGQIVSTAKPDSEEIEEASELYQEALTVLSEEPSGQFTTAQLQGQKMYLFSLLSAETGFCYVILTPSRNINQISSMVASMMRLNLLAIVLVVCLVILLAVLLFFRPIRTLFDGMNEAAAGNFDVRLPGDSSYEINYINTQFNQMTDNIQKLIQENYAQKLLRQDAEIRNIQNQLNEHFLYNTLDTIRWKARMEDAPLTGKMVYDLAMFYRINLASGKHFLPIREVTEMLRSYLDLQKIRMEEQLSFTLSCDPELSGLVVLKYLFQPIIENCFVHGREGLERPLQLDIRFEIENQDFLFCTTDNGMGISGEKLSGLMDSLSQQPENNSGEHFALRLIHQQLLLEYGLTDALHIYSEEGRYCTVEIRIPLEKLSNAAGKKECRNHDQNDSGRR